MRVSVGTTLAVALGLFVTADAAHAQKPPARSTAGDCQTELKQSDGYRELSAALKCLNDRIRALEASRAPAGTNAPRAAVEVAPATSERAQTVMNGALRVEATVCGWTTSTDKNLICRFQASNLTKEDVKFCVGDGTRAVVDSGASHSGAAGFRARVGSIEDNYYRGQKPVCDSVPPLSRIQMTVEFFRSRGHDEKEVQFLRIDCGSGCAYEVYKIPIN